MIIAQYLKSLPGLLGFVLLAGPLPAAQPEPGSAGALPDFNFSNKPHAPIDVVYYLQSIPEAGRSLLIEMQFRSSSGSQIQETSYHSESGLVISDRGEVKIVAGAGDDLFLSQIITVTPAANGLYHLSVFAIVQVDGRSLSRVVSVPVQVGPKSDDPVVAAKRKSATDINGVPIKSLPARTSITLR